MSSVTSWLRSVQPGLTRTDFLSNITHARIIWFEQGNLDTFVVEKAFGLCDVQRGMVGRSVPEPNQLCE